MQDSLSESETDLKSLLRRAIDSWKIDTDALTKPRSTSAVFSLLHANIVEGVTSYGLRGFMSIPTTYGSMILHTDFVNALNDVVKSPSPAVVQSGLSVPTQDQWRNLCQELDDTGAVHLLAEYHNSFNTQRSIHNARFEAAVSLLPAEYQVEILNILPRLPLGGRVTNLVGVLSPFDKKGAPLWNELGIDEEDIRTLADYHKMWECGVILASPLYSTGPKSHDYLTYAMIKAANLGISLKEQMIDHTCVHEGRGHGFTDAVIDYYLGHSELYSAEGLAGALGEDNRNNQFVSTQEITLLIDDKLPRDKVGLYEINYRIMPVFLTRLCVGIMHSQNISKEEAWVKIMSAHLQATIEIAKSPIISADEKHRRLLPETLKILHFDELKEAITSV